MEPENVDRGALFPVRSAEQNGKLVDCCSLLGLAQAPVGQGEVVPTHLAREADNSFLSLTDLFDAARCLYVEHVRMGPVRSVRTMSRYHMIAFSAASRTRPTEKSLDT
jgi:hypothetical protein